MKIKLQDGAIAPTRATEESAGYDLFSNEPEIDGCNELGVGDWKTFRTGVSAAIPPGYVGLVFPRSGLSTKHGIVLRNAVGVIDSDYTGEIMVALHNDGEHETYTVNRGDRVAQLVIVPIITPDLEVVDELGETARGAGGFGSTGI